MTRADSPGWKLLSAAGAKGTPTGRRNGCGVYDPSRSVLFVFGGTADAKTTEAGLFALTLQAGTEAWSRFDLQEAPPLRSSGFGFFDPSRKRVVRGFGNTTTEVFRDLTPLVQD
jgi:hypothetical protein